MPSSRSRNASSAQPTSYEEAFSRCDELIEKLLGNPSSFWFRKPPKELWTKAALGDYFQIIKEPMDLGTVKDNLHGNLYNTRNGNELVLDEPELLRHIALVFRNAMQFNEENSSLYKQAVELDALAMENVQYTEHIRKSSKKKSKRARTKPKQSKSKSKEKSKPKPNKEEEEIMQIVAENPMAGASLHKVKTQGNDEEDKEKMDDVQGAALMRSQRKRKSYRLSNTVNDAQVDQLIKKAKADPPKLMAVSIKPEPELDGAKEAEQGTYQPKPADEEEQKPQHAGEKEQTPEAAAEEGQNLVPNGKMAMKFVFLGDMTEKKGPVCEKSKELLMLHRKLLRKRHQRIRTFLQDRRDRVEEEMSEAQKEELMANLMKLEEKGAYDVMRKIQKIQAVATNNAFLVHENEFEFDLDSCSNDVLREVETVVSYPHIAKHKVRIERIDAMLEIIEKNFVKLRYNEKPSDAVEQMNSDS